MRTEEELASYLHERKTVVHRVPTLGPHAPHATKKKLSSRELLLQPAADAARRLSECRALRLAPSATSEILLAEITIAQVAACEAELSARLERSTANGKRIATRGGTYVATPEPDPSSNPRPTPGAMMAMFGGASASGVRALQQHCALLRALVELADLFDGGGTRDELGGGEADGGDGAAGEEYGDGLGGDASDDERGGDVRQGDGDRGASDASAALRERMEGLLRTAECAGLSSIHSAALRSHAATSVHSFWSARRTPEWERLAPKLTTLAEVPSSSY